MSKRLLTFAFVVCCAATFNNNAFAARAHLAVMGTGDAGLLGNAFNSGGSFYYDDAYNMFYNPAYVNDFRNWATIEKFNGSASAMGGFATKISNMYLGLFVNRADAIQGTWTN